MCHQKMSLCAYRVIAVNKSTPCLANVALKRANYCYTYSGLCACLLLNSLKVALHYSQFNIILIYLILNLGAVPQCTLSL